MARHKEISTVNIKTEHKMLSLLTYVSCRFYYFPNMNSNSKFRTQNTGSKAAAFEIPYQRGGGGGGGGGERKGRS